MAEWTRHMWQHEALDPTPWLPEHLELPAESVGLDLRLEDRAHTATPAGAGWRPYATISTAPSSLPVAGSPFLALSRSGGHA